MAVRLRVGTISGDGIGPEVVAATVPLLARAAAFDDVEIERVDFDWGAQRYLAEGAMMPTDAAARLRELDAVLFGAVGHPEVPHDVTSWGLILPLRQQLGLSVNVRPVRSWPQVPNPLRDADGADLVVVRENSEGEYASLGGRLAPGPGGELAIEVAVHSRETIERLTDYAADLAARRRGKLTLATKSNSLRHGYKLWDEVFERLTATRGLEVEMIFIDALAARLIQAPRSFDVILASNLFGDILSDLASVLAGSLGLAPSANIDPRHRAPGIYEPVHGSAPDIAGRGLANPVACVLSAAMLLADHGCPRGAAALEDACRAAAADGSARTPDVNGHGTTASFAAAIGAALEDLVVAR